MEIMHEWQLAHWNDEDELIYWNVPMFFATSDQARDKCRQLEFLMGTHACAARITVDGMEIVVSHR